jgi:hypothetical protein
MSANSITKTFTKLVGARGFKPRFNGSKPFVLSIKRHPNKMVSDEGVEPSRTFVPNVLNVRCLPIPAIRDGTRGGTWTHNLFRAKVSKTFTYAFRHSGIKWSRNLDLNQGSLLSESSGNGQTSPFLDGRVGEIRTHDFLVPNQAR